MDLKTEQAVWSRVKGTVGMTAEEAVLPERLEGLILQEQADAAALRELSRRMGGQGRGDLTRIANETAARARELTALHYLLTGRRLRVKTPNRPIKGPLPEALRELCLRLEQTGKSYAGLEQEFSERADLFGRCARQSRKQADLLLSQLKNQLLRQSEK